ncbi:MAG: aspartate kinase [Bdellovibrionales bacterium]
MNTTKPLIVQKYGGATLESPEKICAVAQRIAEKSKSHNMIVAVSAMGQTTNQLLDLANRVSQNPSRRELDMLLTTGERVSMALLSMALNDLKTPAISFTGSQAGILTDDSHVNAFIQDLKPQRVEQALRDKKVAVVAGFQGVSPETKEITTLGRGGTDTTAVAMAAYFKAERCEILKDVPAVFSADPRIVPEAKALHQLNYDQLMEMTFWGAKVLHYRSVELARNRDVKLYVGPASDSLAEGTIIQKGLNMYESSKPLSVNSNETVLELIIEGLKSQKALENLARFFNEKQIPFPQILRTQNRQDGTLLLLTGPLEVMRSIEKEVNSAAIKISINKFSTVTMTCTGATNGQLYDQLFKILERDGISFSEILVSAMSMTIVVPQELRHKAVKSLHSMM